MDFDKDDIEATQDALWLTLDPNCNSARKVRTGRFMMFLNATLWLFGTYGARISAILPKTLQEKTVNVEELWSALDGSKAESKPRAPQSGSDTHAIIGRMISGLRYKV